MRTGRDPTVAGGTTSSYQPPFHRIIHLGGERFDSHDRSESDAEKRSVALVRVRFFSSLSALAPHPVGRFDDEQRARRALQSTASHRSGGIYRSVASLNFTRLSRYIYLLHSLRAKFGNASRATSLNVSESFVRARTVGE